ncbi:3-oxoadipate enol-lactonase [Aerolutibacter ruishenii]|uniref:3-oxoadipate enol-lactonase n=1 Tax=Aerolutibacter ruishenii TaxID=686800 RepID=A0A562LVM3_9GAMM|nr:3-oxoadipate enol-lactonase [Lysobacter ruishenii]TWI11642.1 3-oxoadipate enol-lactonase [Lysobacter ruishenii]
MNAVAIPQANAFFDAGHVHLHYRIDGREGAPWLVLSNSLGTDLTMWDPQVDALAAHYRILRYDRRGHGLSSSPVGAYTMADLGGDVLALMDAVGIQRAHFCGLSIGGLVGQWLALNAPHRLGRVVLASTAACIGSAEGWYARIAQVRERGLASLLDGTADRWFTPAYAQAHPERVRDTLARFAATDAEGYAGCCAALATADFRRDLAQVSLPVLALAGRDDPVTPPADLQAIARGVADGRYADVAGRHLCNVESPEAFTAAVQAFLAG